MKTAITIKVTRVRMNLKKIAQKIRALAQKRTVMRRKKDQALIRNLLTTTDLENDGKKGLVVRLRRLLEKKHGLDGRTSVKIRDDCQPKSALGSGSPVKDPHHHHPNRRPRPNAEGGPRPRGRHGLDPDRDLERHQDLLPEDAAEAVLERLTADQHHRDKDREQLRDPGVEVTPIDARKRRREGKAAAAVDDVNVENAKSGWVSTRPKITRS